MLQTRARLRAVLSGSLVVLAYSIPGGWLIFVVGHAVFIQLRDDFLLSGVLLLRLRLSELWFCLIDGRLIQTIPMTWLRPGVLSLFPLFCILSLVAEYYSGPRIHKRRGLCICNIPDSCYPLPGRCWWGSHKCEYHFLS